MADDTTPEVEWDPEKPVIQIERVPSDQITIRPGDVTHYQTHRGNCGCSICANVRMKGYV